MYRLGATLFWIGMLLNGAGLVVAFSGKGWTTSVIGIGCIVIGMFTSQIPAMYLGNEVKAIDESLTAKQVSDLVSRHLREHGDEANDTEVFLGKFGGEFEVVKKYRKAAERGDAEAQYRLGSCYQEGFGVQQDDAEAAKWHRKATEQGYIPPTSNPQN
jgi:hypothetical protein